MDKSWISNNNRLSAKYNKGLQKFIRLSSSHLNEENKIRCPCVMCMNLYFYDLQTIERHIYVKGFYTRYVNWVHHGEDILEESDHDNDDATDVEDFSDIGDNNNDIDHDDNDDMIPVIEDLAQEVPTHNASENFEDSSHKEKWKNFHNLFDEVEKELYPGCTKFSSLTFMVKLMHIKVLTSLSIKGFDMILELLKDAFPDDNKIPNSYYEVKKILSGLGLECETIDVCKDDCCLYWKNNKDATNCPICGHERYEYQGTKGKKIPHKKMHYFPITPRLQRLFMSRHTAADMRWHKEKRVDTEGVLIHPADAEAWKDFDKQYPDFAKEPRNIRLGFATDGFNPFGDLSNSYSMWPVILMPYNMPPWICMKRESLMMVVLIPGRRAPGKDIDVYLQPLIEELKELWEKGVRTFDVVDKTYFTMRAAVLWTINDFPAYGTVSGYSTQGYKACPVCDDLIFVKDAVQSFVAWPEHLIIFGDSEALKTMEKNEHLSPHMPTQKASTSSMNVKDSPVPFVMPKIIPRSVKAILLSVQYRKSREEYRIEMDPNIFGSDQDLYIEPKDIVHLGTNVEIGAECIAFYIR
ncbi:hypothetical protein CsatA_010342 [Cannabis sativa]